MKLAELKDELAAVLGRDDDTVRARLGDGVHYEVEGIEVDAAGVYITVKPVA